MIEFEPKYDKMRPPDNWSEIKLGFFDTSDEIAINSLAVGLERSEALMYFNIQYDDLEAEDQFFFDCCYNKARATAQSRAVSHLFDRMREKGGSNAVLEYLTRFAEKWPKDGSTGAASGFNFKVLMDDK